MSKKKEKIEKSFDLQMKSICAKDGMRGREKNMRFFL